ncbi:MAG: cell wall-binding repeat-containing protein [Pseudolysinimonas sp.]
MPQPPRRSIVVIASTLLAVVAAIAGSAVSPREPAAASPGPVTHTITVSRSDLIDTRFGYWNLPELDDGTGQLTITLPVAELDAHGVTKVFVSGTWFSPSQGGVPFSGRMSVAPDAGPVALPVSSRPADATSYSLIIQSSGARNPVILEGSGTAVAGNGPSAVAITLDPTTAVSWRSEYEYILRTATTAARGDIVDIDVPAGTLTTGPDGGWTGVSSTVATLEGGGNYGPTPVTIASDGSQAAIVVPGRPAVDDTTPLYLVLSQQPVGPSQDSLLIHVAVSYAAVPTPLPTRLGGADRYEAAVNIADSRYGSTGAPVVWIAKGTDYPDALSAAPAAASQGAPLLLTDPNSLPAEVAQEIVKLHPTRIVVVGGTGSVSPAVFSRLGALVPGVAEVRIGGADRYEVSRNVITEAFVDAPGFSGVTRVYLATGRNFPDALSASAVAGRLGAPVLLVDGLSSGVDQPTSDLIAALRLKGPGSAYWLASQSVLIAGGPASVTDAYLDSIAQLRTIATGVARLSGIDRYAASQTIAHEGTRDAADVYLATGLTFPDALAGAAIAGAEGAPLYVVPGTCVPQPVLDDIREYRATRVTLLGGEGSLSPAVAALTPCAS